MEDYEDENAVHRNRIIPPKTEAEIIRLHAEGMTYPNISAKTGISYNAIKKCCERGKPRTEEKYRELVSMFPPLPSPEEILSKCRAMRIERGTWSQSDETAYNQSIAGVLR